jgi:hypothetical protein
MTLRRLVSLAARLLGLVVLATSGVYLLVYLYRWEWNRALISGLFFVAAEIALATGALMQRLDRIEHRIDDLHGGPQGRVAAGRPSEDDETAAREHPFAWLEPDGLGVFVPVLLGIGVILSAIAYVVERVAALSGTWTSGRATERRLALVGASGPAGSLREPSAAAVPRRSDRVRTAAVVVAAFVVLGASVLGLAALTEYRADEPAVPGSASTYLLTVEFRDVGDPVAATQTLTSSCRALIDEGSEIRISGNGETVVMRVSPSPGSNDERRFLGCLNDVTLDRVRVEAERLLPEEDESASRGTVG